MVNVERLCRGCMRELKEGEIICSRCGYDGRLQEERSVKALPAQTILNGRYLIGRVLGEGGFGITYLALDLATETPTAIKEYFPVGFASRDMKVSDNEALTVFPGEQGAFFREGLRKFEEEGRLLAHFQRRDGIVTALDFFAANGTAYLVMEFIEGRSLKQDMYIRAREGTKCMPYEKVFSLMNPIMESLAVIHRAGLIHRDISPDNIIVSPDGKVTLLDFGAARINALRNDNRSMTVFVKHGYAPEEQYRTHGNQGPWTDVYALCALMYEMISGKLPEDSIERLHEDKLCPLWRLQLREPVPEQISNIISKGMAVRQEARYRTVEELLADWRAASREIEAQKKLNGRREAEIQREEEELREEERRREEEKFREEERRREAEIQREEELREEERRREAEIQREEKFREEEKLREEERRREAETQREEEKFREQQQEAERRPSEAKFPFLKIRTVMLAALFEIIWLCWCARNWPLVYVTYKYMHVIVILGIPFQLYTGLGMGTLWALCITAIIEISEGRTGNFPQRGGRKWLGRFLCVMFLILLYNFPYILGYAAL